MKLKKTFILLVLAGSLLLPACNFNAASIISDVSSYVEQSNSSQGGESSQIQPTSSSNNGGEKPSSSSQSAPTSSGQPSSSASGGNSSSSQPSTSSSGQPSSSQSSGGDTTRYEITAAEWDAMFVQYGLMGSSANLTLHQEIKVSGVTVQTAILENNYGDLHMLNNSMGEVFETYIDLLANGNYELYDVDNDGCWEKTMVPATYFAMFAATFSSVIPPLPYSTFTYDASEHAYKSAGGQVDVGNGDKLDVSNVVAKFEDGKIVSFDFDITEEGMTGHASVLASKYGTTSFSFPEVGSPSGHGQGENPDDSLFANSVFRYKGEKDFTRYSKDITKEQIIGYLATSEIRLFADGEFEMFYKDAAGLRYVTLGSYTVPGKTYAELTTRSLYSDKDRAYSFNIPALYENFVLSYVDETGDYEMNIFFLNDDGDMLAKLTIVFAKTDEQPMHLDLPQEPVNDKWSVNGDVWNKYFGGNFINRQTNITINHGENVLAFDNGKVYSKISYAQYGGTGVNEIYLKLLNDELNKVDYYEYDSSNQIWTVRQNVDYAFSIVLGGDTGIKAYDFAKATYNSVGHYYVINSYSEFPYGEEAGYEETYKNIKIYFENNQLQKITYEQQYSSGQADTFLYSKAGSTTVTLPDVGTAPILEDMFVNKAYKYNSYSSSNTAFNIGYYAASLANDEIRFFHDTTDYTFEWLMDNRYYDGSSNNSIVLCGLYKVNRSSSSLFEYQYYITLNVKNVYVNGVELDSETDYQLFETLVLYYFEADNKMCYREDSVNFMDADGRYDYTDLKLYFNYLGENSFHFPLPHLDDNWSQYDVIMAMSQIGVMNDNLPNMHYVKRFVIGQIDTTNKAFDITCEMPNKFFIDHIFEPYKEALVSQYKFSAQYSSDGEIVAVVSPNGEFKVTFEVQEDWIVIFHVQYYTASIPEAEYPSADIERYLTANNITDTVPEFKVAGATQYYPTVSDEYAAVFIYLDKTLIDNAVTALVKLLTDLEYTPSTIGDTTVYSSKNNQVSVVITSNPDYGMINVMLMKPVSSSILSAYPSDKLNEYLRGVRDTVPSFDHQDGEQYMTFGPSEDMTSFNISVYLKSDSAASVKDIIEGFEKDLLENKNYQKVLLTSETANLYGEEYYYVSPNKQVALYFEYSESDKAYNVEFINLTLYSDVVVLEPGSPVNMYIVGCETTFDIGDAFDLGEDAYAVVQLADGTEIEVPANQLEFKPVTFTASGEFAIEVSYTKDGVTVSETIYVWVNEPEQEYMEITITISNFGQLEGMEEGTYLYAIVKSEYAPDGEWCGMEMVPDTENVFTVYDVNSAGQEMTIFVANEDGQVLYFVTVRLIAGQLEYTVTLRSNSGATIGEGGN